MPASRPRITVRRLMVLVAAVAVVLGSGIELERRRRRFERAYREHALAEFEWSVKASLVVGTSGFKQYQPSVAELEEIWGMDAEERRMYETDGGDLTTILRDAGWSNPKKAPIHVDMNKTLDAGGLRALVRGEDHYRRMRRKYQFAALHPWWPVAADPPAPRLPEVEKAEREAIQAR